MSARTLSKLFAVASLAVAFAAVASAPQRPVKLKLEPISMPRAMPASHRGVEGVTRCELCHTVAGWTPARFAHERTGFPLEGAHVDARCKACHLRSFKDPLSPLCSSCHRDPHRGEFGMRCEGCHDPRGWRDARFDALAHRRTAFPLDGKHALLPCTECHREMRDRTFTRPAAGCYSCHAEDYARTSLGGVLDHVALKLSQQCQSCHRTSSFKPARFPEHDRCFTISAGPHAQIACAGCHTSVPSSTSFGTCSTGTAACTACHSHSCARSDAQHAQVPGYQCKDRKCAECHLSGGAP